MTEDGFTPGGNPVCPDCGDWYVAQTKHECSLNLDALVALIADATPGDIEAIGHPHAERGCLCGSCFTNVGFVLDHPSWLHCDEQSYSSEYHDCTDPVVTMPFPDAQLAATARNVLPALINRLKATEVERDHYYNRYDAVRRYLSQCAIFRTEPSTAGLRRVLDGDE